LIDITTISLSALTHSGSNGNKRANTTTTTAMSDDNDENVVSGQH